MPDTGTLPTTGPGHFAHGIHPDPSKALAADKAIEVLPTPKKLVVALLQHIGAPSKAVVNMRDDVTAGQPLSEPGGFVSVGQHAPLAGKVMKQTNATIANGRHLPALPITVAGDGQLEGQALYDAIFGGTWSSDGIAALEPQVITDKVRDAGLVGMGGAAFPTHVKITRNPDKPVDTILVNGCECEPYLTSDYRIMVEAPRPVVLGALIAARAAGAKRVVLATEANKPAAITALEKSATELDGAVPGVDIRVDALAAQYPMGGEKQTVRAALGRTIPDGGLPLDIGVVVINAATATAIAGAVLRDRPFTHRVVAVSGRGIAEPKNLLAPVGVAVQELIDYCGGLTADAERVLAGGPMMGFALGTLGCPVTKGTSGITVLTRSEVAKAERTACIRCGRCVDVCPLELVPARLALASRYENWDMARRYHILTCMECGCCAYTCPASIPLVQLIRQGKATLPRD